SPRPRPAPDRRRHLYPSRQPATTGSLTRRTAGYEAPRSREQLRSPQSRTRGAGMATYVTLVSWTDQGIRNFRETAQRAGDFARLAEGAGGRVREQLWTVGEYDMVCVVEFPDDETGAAAILRAGAAGNIRTRTMRAFGADEM